MEQTLIQAQFKKTKLPYLIIIIGLLFIYLLVNECLEWYEYGGTTVVTRYYASGGHDSHWQPYTDQYSSFMDFFWNHCLSNPFESDDIPAPLFLGLVFIISSFVLWRMMNCCALTVTNSRIIGKASFGKPVEIPINQISTVTLGKFNRLSVGTPYGKKSFWMIANRNDVHAVLMNAVLSSENSNSTTDSNLTPKQTPIISTPAPNTSAVPETLPQRATVPQGPTAPQSTATNPIVPQNTVVHENTWTCRCGRIHEYYISSCSCGLSKREIQNSK